MNKSKSIKWDYELYDKQFDGTNAIDTGIIPFEDINKNWQIELIFKSDSTIYNSNDSVLACQKYTSPYAGLTIVFSNNTDGYKGFYVECEYPIQLSYYLGETIEKTKVTITFNNNKFTINSTPFDYTINQSFDRHLILGANQLSNGGFYRYWKGYIYSFKFRWL